MNRWTLLACVTVLMALAGVAGACPSCKDSIADTAAMGGPGGPSSGLPSGFNVSVYLMLVGFFVVLGLVIGIIVKGMRGTNNAQSGPYGFPVAARASMGPGAGARLTSPQS